MSVTQYDSRKNTLKRDPSSGSTNMAAPSTSAYSGDLLVTNLTIAHNLGYVPAYRYYYEPFGDGVIWGQLSGRSDGDAQQPTHTTTLGPGIIAWMDSTAPFNLHIQLFSDTINSPFTGTFPVYWVIYRDFSLS